LTRCCSGFAVEAGQYLLNYRWVFNAGNGCSCASMRSRQSCIPAHHLHWTLAVTAHFNLNAEHALEALGPGHGGAFLNVTFVVEQLGGGGRALCFL
jgi:hypothetical protein